MTSLDLEHFAKAVAEIGFIAGVVGGIFGLACARVLDDLTDMFLAWEERRCRIGQARQRSFDRACASAQADQARACEREGGMRPMHEE